MLDKDRLKAKIKAAFIKEQPTEEKPEDAADRIAEAIAQAVVDEIKNLKITYTSGLVAGTSSVTGTLNNTLS